MINVQPYKDALSSGDRAAICAAARDLVAAVGKLPTAADEPHVNASHGQDNSAERIQIEKNFNKQAFAVTDTADGYNKATGAAAGAAAQELVAKVQALESSQAALLEIARIDAGDKFGGGRGMDQGQVESVTGLLHEINGKLDKLLAR